MEKVHIAFEVDKQIKERFVAAEAFIQGTSISLIVSSDAFQREIDSIPNSVVTTPGLVDRLCSGNAIMNASRCSGWLSQTQTLPNYLDQQTVKRYHDVRRMVEQRLHNCRVQGVVSMFNELSSEEKEECLKILQKTN